jgi:serine/threonine protein kinase
VLEDYIFDDEPVGFGGCATIRRGLQRGTNDVVALKEAFPTPIHRARLRREILVQLRLEHPHVMPILDYDALGYSWFVMPFADPNLEEHCMGTSWSVGRLAPILGDAWAGLTMGHSEGFVHRDVTPRNLLRLARDCWVVSDWGLVSAGDRREFTTLTRAGASLGTEGFIAPEVVDDPSRATPASDAYSLGMVARWALSETTASPPSVRSSWDELLEKTTAKDPKERAVREVPDLLVRLGAPPLRLPQPAPIAVMRNDAPDACINCGSVSGFVGHNWNCAACGWPNLWYT